MIFKMPKDGVALKSAALDRLSATRSEIIVQGQRALLLAILKRGDATADDVRAGVELPEGVDPVCLGAVPSALARAGIIRRAGYANTTRSKAHARPVSVWALADRAAAERWLANHPGPDGPLTVQRRLF